VNEPPKLQPALFGGLVIGVLSALPIISLGNCCCCLWVVSGGVIAAWIMQANHPYAITVADGAVAGLLAGLVGAVVLLLLSVPISITLGPIHERLLERLVESSTDLPPAMREMFENARADRGPIGLAISFVFQLVVGSMFSTVGGILGALLFRKGPAAGTAPPAYPGAPPDVPPPAGY